jgi:hypothetical protein
MAQINKPNQYFNSKLYTGNSSTQSITGVGFQPDFVWMKQRNATNSHVVIDSVRGVLKRIRPDQTDAEDTLANSLTAFGSDGFTLGSAQEVNDNSDTYASWNWLGANGTTANTDGSITSTVSVNTTSGFSIVSWTGNATAGATVGHGLGVTPKVIILKGTDQTDGWFVQHQDLGATKFLRLQDTNAVTTQTNVWNDTAPTSNVFSVGNGSGTNGNGNQFITYCFAEKKGFSKFGSYTGNGNADGTFVYTGFKPAWVMIKASSTAQSWQMSDNKRDTFNAVDHRLRPNESGAESTSPEWIDFCSNGFKLRNNDVAWNGSGQTYIFMAFAENPLVGTNNIPATAR